METCFEIDIQNKTPYFDSAGERREQIFQLFSDMHLKSSISFFFLFFFVNTWDTFEWLLASHLGFQLLSSFVFKHSSQSVQFIQSKEERCGRDERILNNFK